MDLQVVSFVLALVVASLCFALVKLTADEFDRWYTEQKETAHRVGAIQLPAVLSVVVIAGAVLLSAFLC